MDIELNLKIKKAKLCKGGTVEATYYDADGNEIIIKGTNTAHEDLKNRLAQLVPYFADLTEQREADNIDWDNLDSEENATLLKPLSVNGVSEGGDDTSPVATLTGKRVLASTKVLNLNSPTTDLEDNDWPHTYDFRDAIDAFFFEVGEYILHRKWGAKQMEINFDNPEDPFAEVKAPDSMDITHEDAKKLAEVV